MARIQKAPAAFAALLMLAGTAACSDGSGTVASDTGKANDKDQASIRVDRSDVLADQPTGIRVTGLKPGQRVSIAASAQDQRKLPWASEAEFTADAKGVVDLGKAAPRGGEPYEKADSMGLLASMLPQDKQTAKTVGSGKAFSYHPAAPAKQRAYSVRLTVSEAGGGNGDKAAAKTGREIADRDITRRWLFDGVQHKRLTVKKDKVDGELYTPPKGSKKRAPVLVFGGSEGGNSGEYTAALLASHGHPAMSLCYFDCGKGSDRPRGIDMIDLDYFVDAAEILGKEPAADPKKLAVMGNSRGSEVAQLLAQRHPDVVKDVIAYAPSAKINGPLDGDGPTAWASGGKPIPPGPISLDRVRGRVVAIAGGNDKMWDSAGAARRIAAQKNASGLPHKQVTYKDAGHHVNWFPYGQPGQEGGADGEVVSTSDADQHARAESWTRVLQMLERS